MAIGTFTGDGFNIEGKLAFRVTIAGVKNLAIARLTLQQFALTALRTGNGGFVRLIDHFSVIALRVIAATDKHAIAPTAQHQRRTALRALLPIQHLDDMPIGLRFQRANILAFRVLGTAEEGAVATATDHQLGPAFRTGFILHGGKNRVFVITSSMRVIGSMQITFVRFKQQFFHLLIGAFISGDIKQHHQHDPFQIFEIEFRIIQGHNAVDNHFTGFEVQYLNLFGNRRKPRQPASRRALSSSV